MPRLILLIALLLGPGLAWAEPQPEAVPKPVGLDVAGPFIDRGDGVFWSIELREPNSAYMRVFFTNVVSPAGVPYTLVARGADNRILARFEPAEFGAAADYETPVLFSEEIRLELQAPAPPQGLSFRLDHYLYQLDLQGRTVALSNVPTWRNVHDTAGVPEAVTQLITQSQEAVAKLFIGSGVVCTSFLISPSAILTNFHCLVESTSYQRTKQSPTPGCSDIWAHFDYNRQPAPDAVVRVHCLGVVVRDEALDVAVLRVDPAAVSPGKLVRRPLRLANRDVTAKDGEDMVVVHHPGGLAKSFTWACRAYPASAPLVEHDCSTMPGSSGAALIARDGAIVGVHYAGPFDENMTQREINAAVRRGQTFRNKARATPAVLNLIRGRVP